MKLSRSNRVATGGVLMRSRSRIFDPDLSAQVAALFASLGSTPKLWLDPSDSTTRFQDQAGTTLVTADDQPYGRANDKSGGGNHVGQVTTTSRPLWKTDGVLSWAQADGTDDSWQSLANFDCSSTDKITLIAGLRKESNAALGVFAELTATYNSTVGGFAIFGPANAGVGNYSFAMNAGVAGARAASGYAAPMSNVLSVRFDAAQAVANDKIAPQINGVVPSLTSSVGSGTSAFASALLNVMRRNNTTLPFNGRLYGLMIIGRLLTADELSLCERYMAQKSGVVLP